MFELILRTVNIFPVYSDKEIPSDFESKSR